MSVTRELPPMAKKNHTIGASTRTAWTLNRRASFWVSFCVSVHTLWTSAAPALSYRLYAKEWRLSPIETTGVFAIYPVFVAGTLVLLGDVSDHIGRRLTMLVALACSLAGALILACAVNLEWLLAARAIMGVGVGLGSGSSTAAILEFSADGDPERAAAATNVAQAIGFATALLLGGALIQYAPWPLRLDFLVLAAVIIVLMVGVWFLPQRIASADRWSPRMPNVPANIRGVFGLASLAAVIAFASGAVLLSLGGEMAHDLVDSASALTNGAILASFAIVSAVVTGFAKKLSPKHSLLLGAVAASFGLLLLWLATSRHDLPILLAATSFAGVGYALLFLGALAVLNAAAPVDNRGGVLSAFYLIGYLSMGSFALALGAVARTWGLAVAVATGSFTLVTLAVVTFAFAAARPLPVTGRSEKTSEG